jgi:hypothetical protein
MLKGRYSQDGDDRNGPTVDSIEVAACESQADLKEWLRKNAPAFLQ